MNSERWATRHRDAMLGTIPIVTLLVSLAVVPRLAALLGVPERLGLTGGIVLAVAGFFVSRAILRRGFAPKAL